MANNLDASLEQKKLKSKLTIYTIVYTIVFPFLAYVGWLSPMAVSGPSTPNCLVLPLILMILLIPISVPVSIYLMWSRYCSKNLDKARKCALLPIYTIASVFTILEVTSRLARMLPKLFNVG